MEMEERHGGSYEQQAGIKGQKPLPAAALWNYRLRSTQGIQVSCSTGLNPAAIEISDRSMRLRILLK